MEDLKVGVGVKNIYTTALLRKARMLRRVLETCCHSNSSEKPSAKINVENSLGVNNNKKEFNPEIGKKIFSEGLHLIIFRSAAGIEFVD